MKFGARELLFFVLLVAIPVGAYFWVFKPANISIKEKQAKLEEKAQKLENLHRAARDIKDLSKEIENLAEAVKFFESKLPTHHEIHKVLAQVTKIADKHRLETKLFQTLKPNPFANYSEQPINMEVHGDFDSYYQFILDVEKLPRITKIKEMALEKAKNNEGNVNAKFKISIYFDSNNLS